MLRNDEQWLALTDEFYSAAIDGSRWYKALDGLARATGSSVGELICLGPDAAVPVNIMTNVDPGFHHEFVAAGGGDPAVNPRVNAGMKAPVLKVLAESDFITPDEYRRNAHYQEFAIPNDIPYICLVTLDRTPDLLIGLAVARNEAQGHIDAAGRAVFESLAPHVRAAARIQLSLEGQGAALLSGAMEALSMPAFVCDRAGRVHAMTPAAERLIDVQRGLQLRQNMLQAANPLDATVLRDAIEVAAAPRRAGAPPAVRTVMVRGDKQAAPSLVLDVIGLPPRPFDFSQVARILVVARGERVGDERRAVVLQAGYALTAAETDIALQLTRGRTTEAIAGQRGVSVATVRSQIKAIMAKTGVGRQAELVALVADF